MAAVDEAVEVDGGGAGGGGQDVALTETHNRRTGSKRKYMNFFFKFHNLES